MKKYERVLVEGFYNPGDDWGDNAYYSPVDEEDLAMYPDYRLVWINPEGTKAWLEREVEE